MNIQTYKEEMDDITPSPDLLKTTKNRMKEKSVKTSVVRTNFVYRPKLAAAIIVALSVITVGTVALAATGAFSTYITPPPFTGEDGEANLMAEHAYAMENFNNNGKFSQPYYTREQITQHFIDTGGTEYYAAVRQPHIQPEPFYPDDEGISLCNNTVFAVIDKQRVCRSCGYIFTEQQNADIGWNGE